MIKLLRVIVLVLTVAAPLFAQSNPKIDSLEKLLAKVSINAEKKIDTTLIQALNSLCWEYRLIGDYEKALQNGQRAAAEIERIEKSLEPPLEKVFQNIKEFQKLKVQTLRYIGIVYGAQNNYPVALEYFQKSLDIAQKTGDKSLPASIYNNIGLVFTFQGKYLEAASCYMKSLKIAEESGDRVGAGRVYHNLGLIYKEQRNYDEALKHYFKALKFFEEIHSKETGQILNNIGNIYEAQRNNTKAMEFYLKSLQVKQETGDKAGQAEVYHNMGLIYNNEGDYGKAMNYFREALKIFEKIGDKGSTAISYLSMGRIYLQQSRYKQAVDYCEKSLSLYQEVGDKDGMKDANLLLSVIYARQHDFKKAYQYEHQYVLYADTLHDEKVHRQIAEIQTRYETEKKQLQIEQLNKDKELQRLKILNMENEKKRQKYVFAGSFLLLIIFIAWWFSYWQIKRKNEKIQLEMQLQELEHQALRLQMNPHFIFNSLTSIGSFIGNNETAQAKKFLTKFARLMRLILQNSRQPFVPLQDELDIIQYYMELEQLRFDHKFHFRIKTDPSIDTQIVNIPPMLIQPHVENAILHGIVPKEADGQIDVELRLDGDRITCEIQDNGIGRKKARELKKNSEAHQSVALTVTEERLSMLNTSSHHAPQIAIIDLHDEHNQPSGTKIIFAMPFRRNN